MSSLLKKKVALLAAAGLALLISAGVAAAPLVAPNPTAAVDGATEDFDELAPADFDPDAALFKMRPGPGLPAGEFAAVEGQLGLFTNPNVALPLSLVASTPNAARIIEDYSQQLWSCLQKSPWYGPGLRRLDADDQLGLRSVLRLYSLVVLAEDPLISVPYPDDCSSKPGSRLVNSTLGIMIVATFSGGGSTAVLAEFLQRLRATRGASQSDIVALYILKHFGQAFRMYSAEVRAVTLTDFKDPASLLMQKTTPSLQFNNTVAAALEEVVSWKSLGMNEYTKFGYNPISAWIANKQYDHPILASLIPVLGPAWEALDAWESMREGKNAAGQDQSRLFSAGLLTLNTVAAMLDVPSAKGLIAGSAHSARWLAKSARRAKTVDEVALKLQALSVLLKGAKTRSGVAVGEEALKAWKALGRPVKTKLTLVNRAMGHTLETSTQYVDTMGLWMAAELRRIYRLRKSGSLPTDTSTIRSLFDDVLEQISRGSRHAALNSGSRSAARFGAPLEDNVNSFSTYIADKHAFFQPMLTRFVKKGRRVDADIPLFSSWMNQIVGTLPDGTVVPLGRVTQFDSPKQLADGALYDTVVVHWHNAWGAADASGSIVPHIEKVMAHVAQLFGRAVNPARAATNAEVIDLVAEMHWWLANLTPYERGSNGIADAFSKTVLRSRGIRVGMWKKEVSPDYWAFTHDLEDYKKIYPSLFDDLSDAAAPDLTLLPVMQGFGGTARYPAQTVGGKPLMEGLAKLVVSGPVKALTGYVAARVLMFLQPEGEGDTRIQGIINNVRVVYHYNDGRPEKVVLAAANQDSPADMPAELRDEFANTKAGFSVALSDADYQAYLAGVLTLTVYAQDAVFEDERVKLGTFSSSPSENCDYARYPKRLVVSGPDIFLGGNIFYPSAHTFVSTTQRCGLFRNSQYLDTVLLRLPGPVQPALMFHSGGYEDSDFGCRYASSETVTSNVLPDQWTLSLRSSSSIGIRYCIGQIYHPPHQAHGAIYWGQAAPPQSVTVTPIY